MSGVDQTTATKASTATFVTSLVFNAIVFGAELAAFTILRPYFKAIYEPRTYVPVPSKRVAPLCPSFLRWPLAVYNADYKTIIKANGMDAYFFVRFLRMMVKVFLPIWVVSWIVLLPTTSVNTTVGTNSGLDRFVFGNIAADKQTRYAAHIICVWIFTGWVFYNIKLEMRHFVIMRQKHLIDPVHSKSVQANTMLVTGIPARYLTQKALLDLFKDMPGGINRIWINRNLKSLPDIYDRRMTACNKLESAETSLLNTAAKLRAKALKAQAKKGKTAEDATPDLERNDTTLVPADKRPKHRLGWIPFHGPKVDTIEWAREEIRVCNELLEAGRADLREFDGGSLDVDPRNEIEEDGGVGSGVGLEEREVEGDGAVRRRQVPGAPKEDKHGFAVNDGSGSEDAEEEIERRRVETGAVPVAADSAGLDEKALTKAEKKLAKKEKKKEKKEKKSHDYPALNSAFITFNRQIAAHLAMQVLTHHEPYRMSGKYIEVSPEDVIWGNLGMNPYEQKVRILISYAMTAGLIILWAFPVAFIGIVSNISVLSTTYTWLSWLGKLPSVVIGIISGILPPVLLAVLMMLLPIILRLLARFEGIPKKTGLELSLMSRFFIFQVIHSFLIVTLSSGIIAALPQLVENPTGIPGLLADNLPSASTFFLTYVLLQGLSGTAGGFLQIVPLAIYYVKLYLLGSTPRSVYNIKYGARSVAWGTTFPGLTLLVVIALGYSIISPIINGFACASFFAFYMLYKYLFLWQFQQSPASDTGGLFFPKAIQHIFVGLYVQQVCLCALFFLAQDANGNASAVPEGALMIVLIVFTFFFQMLISNSYGPLLRALPLTLADKTYTANSPVPGEALYPRKSNVSGVEGDESKSFEMLQREKTQNAPSVHSERDGLTSGAGMAAKVVSEEEYGFAHPATSRPQRVVWIPRDLLGLAEEEEKACRDAGVEVSARDAEMNEKGQVDISGPPPDMFLED